MLQVPSSELAQRFSDMWVSRALELGVGVSVEPLPSAIHRGLVMAIAGLPLRSTYVVAKWILLAQTFTSISSSEMAPSPQSRGAFFYLNFYVEVR